MTKAAIVDGEAPEIIVGGHLCLDIIPSLRSQQLDFRPGALEEIGNATVSTGGCVSNTGISLVRLGARVQLVSRVGDDLLGECLQGCLHAQGIEDLTLNKIQGEFTSYSLVLSPPGRDRMVLHYPGTNNTFDSSDLLAPLQGKAKLFHFGYPPLMRRMYENCGVELRNVFCSAHAGGMITSLDMAYPDSSSAAGRVNWRSILTRTLPFVDFFLPSYDEIVLMLGLDRTVYQLDETTLLDQLEGITSSLLQMGASIVGIKLGERGLYVRSAADVRMDKLSEKLATSRWVDRELWTTVFDTKAVGTTGAGDATIAGFLYGILKGFEPEEVCSAACAVGASSVEAADATSGVKDWHTIKSRMENGWIKKPSLFLAKTSEVARGVFSGPLDRGTSATSAH